MRIVRKGIRVTFLLVLSISLVRLLILSFNKESITLNRKNTKISFSNVLSDYLKSLNNSEAENEYCSSRYGKGLILNWKTSNDLACSPIHSQNSKEETSIQCHFHLDKSKENICEAYNLQLNVDGILSLPSLDSKQAVQGAFKGQCTKNQNIFQWDRFGHGAQEWLFRSFDTQDTPLQCDKWIDHNIFFVGRWDTTNLFHAHEDMIQTFAAFLVTNTDPVNTQVVLADQVALGPYMSFWDHIASNVNGPISPEDIDTREGKADSYNLKSFVKDYINKNPNIKTICLKRAIFGVHAGISPLSREIGTQSSCRPPSTSLLLYYKRFVLERLNLPQDETWIPLKASKNQIQLSYMSRKGFTRAIENEDLLLHKLSQLSTIWPQFKLEVHDFQNISFYKQIKVARNTDILLGGHGAALTISFYIPENAILLEITHPERSGNYHFSNIANFMGIQHEFLDGSSELSNNEIDQIVNKVKEHVFKKLNK